MSGIETAQSDVIDYHRRREGAERKMAERAIDPIARRLHHDMAERHAEVARSGLRPVLKIAGDI